jgi:phenylalanyl-tRNA synthetase beta chain
MAAMGYQETINFSFVEERWERELCGNPNPIKLLNPIASQMSVMRSSLLGSLLQVLKFNLDRKTQRVRVFELGRVFLRDADAKNTDTTVEGFRQPMRVAGMACGTVDAPQWGRQERSVDYFDVKGDVEALLAPRKAAFVPAAHPAMHPGRCANILLNGTAIGFVGELHPKWRQAYDLVRAPVMFELDLDSVLEREVPTFKAVGRFQTVERDIAVIVSETVSHDAMMKAVWEAPTMGLLRDVVLFDIYRPKVGQETAVTVVASSEKSMAVRLSLNGEEATLTDDQIDTAVQAVLSSLTGSLGARQRA